MFAKVGIGITDIFLKVKRENNSNLDQHLIIEKYNDVAIRDILQKFTITKILFTSKFVESHFFKKFPEVKFAEYLPSPSPRFARMSKADKIEAYKEKLPKL